MDRKDKGNESTPPLDRRNAKWKRISARLQRPGESLVDYIYSKLILCMQLRLTFNDTKEQILIGLMDRTLCNTMLARVHS